MTNSSKIKIKMGPIEVEYEGSESFLKEELPEILKAVSDLYKEAGSKMELPNSNSIANPQLVETDTLLEETTGSLAAKLSSNSGPELIIAAAAQLTFVQSKDRFTRKEISDSIKTASAYYKNSYGSNLTTYLNNLVKDGSLLEKSKDVYALSATKLKQLKSSLA
ncbi:hypothetical protein [Ekhidna sp.]